jgi:chemotaxis protein histidine kinase CheA
LDAEDRAMSLDDDDVPELDPDMQARLAAVEAVVAALDYDLATLIGTELGEAQAALALIAGGSGDRQASCEGLFRALHDMKGLGGSFGFPLVSRVADSACEIMRKRTVLEGEARDRVAAHVAALQDIHDENLKGDGGDAGAAICRRLGIVD